MTMSTIGNELSTYLAARSEIVMRNAISDSDFGTSDSTVNARRDQLIVTMSGLAQLDMSGFLDSGSDTDTVSNTYDTASLIASFKYPEYFESGGSSASIFSSGTADSILTSGYESMVSADDLAALIENPAQAILAQTNAISLNVLKLFG